MSNVKYEISIVALLVSTIFCLGALVGGQNSACNFTNSGVQNDQNK